jgi:hypothetical protein
MEAILLLGPREDGAILSFSAFLRKRDILFEHCSSVAEFSFTISIDSSGLTKSTITLPKLGTVDGQRIGVFIRSVHSLALLGKGCSEFRSHEQIAALWSLCATLPRVVNRPTRFGWASDEAITSAIEEFLLQEVITTTKEDLLRRWTSSRMPEAHIENLLTYQKKICLDKHLLKWFRFKDGVGIRALFAPNNNYLVFLTVGERQMLLADEAGIGANAKDYQAISEQIATVTKKFGVRLYASAFLLDQSGLKLTRILTEPPFSWYSDSATKVNEALLTLLHSETRIQSAPVNR